MINYLSLIMGGCLAIIGGLLISICFLVGEKKELKKQLFEEREDLIKTEKLLGAYSIINNKKKCNYIRINLPSEVTNPRLMRISEEVWIREKSVVSK